jgi:hypothetical protein
MTKQVRDEQMTGIAGGGLNLEHLFPKLDRIIAARANRTKPAPTPGGQQAPETQGDSGGTQNLLQK